MADSGAPHSDQSSSVPYSSESASFLSNLPLDLTEDPPNPPNHDHFETNSAAATNTNSTSARTTPRTPFTPSTSASAPAQPSQFRAPSSASRNIPMTQDDSSRAAKVAIPRLKRSLETGDVTSKPGGRHRVTHACEPCRHRKTKCSGERPTCRHCQDFKIQCYYADGKRDRVKKQFGSMAEKVSDYERILRDLQTRVSEADASLIRNSLDRAAMLDADDIPAEAATVAPLDNDNDNASEASGAESEASGGAGSTGALDKTDEDFTRDGAKATGFMGKNSDVTWIQRLRHENKQTDATAASTRQDQRAPHDVDTPVQDSSYHLNDLPVSPFEAVDLFEMPTPDHARILFNIYMERVHATFPIVGRINLQNQFTKYLARPMNRPPRKWLAILNVIFAISARLSHLVQAEWRGDDRDHLIYFTRARLLSVDADTLFSHPDLQTIQIFGLMSFYLLSVEQINRAWSLTGVAIRYATSLGLNMRNESSELTDGLKEIRYRVWWALYILDHRLCTMTGRIGCIVDEHCTTPLPVPVLEEDFDTEAGQRLLSADHQRSVRAPSLNPPTPSADENMSTARGGSKDGQKSSRSPSVSQSQQTDLEWAKDVAPNSALYFLHLTQLCRITQAVFQMIYNPSAVTRKWSEIQSFIETLNQRAENWYRALPATLDFGRKQRDRELYEPRLTLGFHYYAAKQIINRPCLCRLDLKIPGQSSKSDELNHACALACVNAAREQMSLIPDEPNGPGLLRVGPWVTLVHMLVQSATVLMLELSFRAHHMPDQVDQILEAAKKAVRWLHALGDENLAAARAWQLCSSMLVDAAKKTGRSVSDMPKRRPRSYESPDSDMYMSGHPGMGDMGDMGAMPPRSYGQNAAYAQPNMMGAMTMADLQSFPSYTVFDNPGPYDHYMSSTGPEVAGMSNQMDMHYMNAYSNQNPSDTGGSGGSQARGSGMPGFG